MRLGTFLKYVDAGVEVDVYDIDLLSTEKGGWCIYRGWAFKVPTVISKAKVSRIKLSENKKLAVYVQAKQRHLPIEKGELKC